MAYQRSRRACRHLAEARLRSHASPDVQASAQRHAAELGLALVAPDTSPRGLGIEVRAWGGLLLRADGLLVETTGSLEWHRLLMRMGGWLARCLHGLSAASPVHQPPALPPLPPAPYRARMTGASMLPVAFLDAGLLAGRV